MKPSNAVIGVVPLTIALFTPMEAQAGEQPVQLDTMVTTSTLTPKHIEEAPGSVQLIDAESIRLTGAQNVAQALEEAVGLDLDHVSGRGLIPQIRGLTNKRVLILIDGMRFASGFRDTTLDLSEFPAEIIQRIEVVRGPSSALYGSEALGGVINIITRKPPDKASGSTTLQYGANEDGEADNLVVKGFVGDTWDRLGVSFSGQLEQGELFDRDLQDDLSDFDDERRHSGMLNLHYRLSRGHAVSAGAFLSHVNREGIRPKYGLRWDREADSDRLSSFIRYDGKFGDTTLMARAYYSDFESERSYIDIGAPYVDPSRQQKANKQPDREDFLIENELTQFELHASHWFGKSHLVTLGLEHREEKRSGIENRGEREIDQTVKNRAVFLQDDFELLENLDITGGVRLDDHSDFGSEVSPRLALVYVLREGLRLNASYGQGFRAPSVYERYVYTENNKGDVIPNPDLEPETASSYELGIEGESGPFRGSATLFRNDIDNMIYKEPTGNFRTSGSQQVLEYTRVNIGEARTQGAELEASLALPRGFSLTGNFTYIDAENKDSGDKLLEVPESKTYLRLAYDNPRSGWHTNIRFTHVGEQIIAPVFADGSQDKEDAYNIFNFYLEKNLSRNLRLYGGVNNIFDEIPEFKPERGTFYFAGVIVGF